jgi:hypothetical protein
MKGRKRKKGGGGRKERRRAKSKFLDKNQKYKKKLKKIE